MVVLDASRRNQRVPPLALWSLGAGIVATIGANLAHGLGHGPIGVLVSAWPALALVGSFELLMQLVRAANRDAKPVDHDAPAGTPVELTLDDAVRSLYQAGTSQRAIARELNIDRRKVKCVLDQVKQFDNMAIDVSKTSGCRSPETG